MRFKTLVHEPSYDHILHILDQKVAQEHSLPLVSPTPIISPFWETTFTPSSSEVIFRQFASDSLQKENNFYTIQPCVRINDLPNIVDGWHGLLFHMTSFFFFEIEEMEPFLNRILHRVAEALNLQLSDFYFTVSPRPYCSERVSDMGLGSEFLLHLGIDKEQIIECSGSDNYQNSHRVTASNQRVSMSGPKVEIYIKPLKQDRLYEIGTFELASCNFESLKGIKEKKFKVFAFAFGLERIASLVEEQTNLSKMKHHKELVEVVCQSCLYPSMANSSLGFEAISQILLILDALAFVSPQVTGASPQNRGVVNHYRRIVRSLARNLKGVGLSLSELLNICSSHIGQDLSKQIDVDLVLEQVRSESMGSI